MLQSGEYKYLVPSFKMELNLNKTGNGKICDLEWSLSKFRMSAILGVMYRNHNHLYTYLHHVCNYS